MFSDIKYVKNSKILWFLNRLLLKWPKMKQENITEIRPRKIGKNAKIEIKNI